MLDPRGFSGLTQGDCVRIQEELAGQVVQSGPLTLESLRRVAGVDLAYWREGDRERAVCCIVVIQLPERTVVEKCWAAGDVTFPYIPGCLAFRELPLVVEAAALLEHRPDLFVFDGNGILHPRSMGLASHASFYLNTPTVGMAKSYFKVEGARFDPPGPEAGMSSDIVREGRVLGRALRTRREVRPIFVSVGNWIDLDTACKLALALTDQESHIPIPTRYADLETHIQRETLRGVG
ncbi:endonuclease V [Pseudoflavonifractor sp. 60]|uniref:endonuclease V n=1 Tax=Pseudoflavonifractor sp. 60 TaxID=2304576 RepID=UPI00136C8057|nr:endonuclease V [Pseudoflavonifractor sp. 60]NBI67543.1 endonuclease V [Pseudoflavonifractor sp. 60]